jgi:hypothetical protein
VSATDYSTPCEGCGVNTEDAELSELGYCPSCEYEYEANLDHLTGGDNE